MPLTCPRCGQPAREAGFCLACGAPVQPPPPYPPPPYYMYMPPPPPASTKPRKPRGKGSKPMALVGAALCLLCGLYELASAAFLLAAPGPFSLPYKLLGLLAALCSLLLFLKLLLPVRGVDHRAALAILAAAWLAFTFARPFISLPPQQSAAFFLTRLLSGGLNALLSAQLWLLIGALLQKRFEKAAAAVALVSLLYTLARAALFSPAGFANPLSTALGCVRVLAFALLLFSWPVIAKPVLARKKAARVPQ